ncbi:NusB antitermination factor [Fibrobacter intestinalis]|uniref:Transcription antitermination protein NusB n=1 Tax=Fibrobacter intestinalis TaxID=28122 RepID=A0A1M6X8S6_9BACT|nr:MULTISPECIES: transcription antitermination factor NusB [Fibrobacter]MDD7299647.1 transcription antitermination factor NusB [Fibrobacter intestinalis]PBC66823.1 NusB antitermination factor [Fibrobacter sp. UWS1]PBC75220.1 NusB antitermination factor [Fibrobacter sp. NR9]SHL02185.1 NusB antitermination factor [Fibrobacter intestinalis]SKA11532.1 NusB antitermination factor [Fibrobacter intestinalis]
MTSFGISKRSARVFAMELLYAMELTKQPVGKCVDGILDSMRAASKKELAAEMKRYGMSLVDLIQEHRAELDALLEEYSQGWSLDRLAILDRLLLYIALTELQYKPDVPVKVVINEAVEIANKFSTENSSRFINGILNQFARSKGMLASDNQEERSK